MKYNPTAEYSSVPRKSQWVFNKLALSEALGYECGPVGEEVDVPGWYCVRPIMNLKGMGEGATIKWIDCSTDHLPAGYFWCERFRGVHLSVDYEWGEPVLAVMGIRSGNCLSRWDQWIELTRVSDPCLYLEIPDVLYPVVRSSKFWNIEYIGDKAIEIQAHNNSDFRWGNQQAVPVYSRQEKPPPGQGWKYVNAPDGERLGLWIR